VAEAGSGGGTLSTVGLCDQIQPPLGPALGGTSARILEFGPSGYRVVADNLPSSELTALVGGDRQGIASLTFVGNHLLALEAGAGCSHGHSGADNGVFSVDGGGLSMLANVAAGISGKSINHDEVLATATDMNADLGMLLQRFFETYER
jgi:hypothetical protein